MSGDWAAPGSAPPPERPGGTAGQGGYPGAAPGGQDQTPYPAAPPPDPSQAWGTAGYQPGVVPLRPLTLGDIFTGVVRTVRASPAATIGLAAVVSLAVIGPLTALASLAAATLSSDLPGETTGIGDLFVNVPSYISSIVTAVLTVFVSWVTYEGVMGRRATIGGTWRATRGRLLAAIGALVLSGLLALLVVGPFVGAIVGLIIVAVSASSTGTTVAVVLGSLLLGALAVAAGLWLYTRLALVYPAVTLERLGPVQAIRRSFALTTGREFWRVLGIRLLVALLLGIISFAISVPIALIISVGTLASTGGDGGAFLAAQTAATGLAAIITSALTSPLAAATDALLYVDLRIRREGHDIELVRRAGETAGPGRP